MNDLLGPKHKRRPVTGRAGTAVTMRNTNQSVKRINLKLDINNPKASNTVTSQISENNYNGRNNHQEAFTITYVKPELKMKNVEIKLRGSNSFFRDGDPEFEKYMMN